MGVLWSITYTTDCVRFVRPDLDAAAARRFEAYREQAARLKTGFFDVTATEREDRLAALADQALPIVFEDVPAALAGFLADHGVRLVGRHDLVMPDIKIRFCEAPDGRFAHIRRWKLDAIAVETWINLLYFVAVLGESPAFAHLGVRRAGLQGETGLDAEIECGVERYCYWLNRLAQVNRHIKIPHPYSRQFFLRNGLKQRLFRAYRRSRLSMLDPVPRPAARRSP